MTIVHALGVNTNRCLAMNPVKVLLWLTVAFSWHLNFSLDPHNLFILFKYKQFFHPVSTSVRLLRDIQSTTRRSCDIDP